MIGSKECCRFRRKERKKERKKERDRCVLYSAYILRNQTDDTQ